MPNAKLWKRVVACFTLAGTVFICFEAAEWFHPPLLVWGLSIVDPHLICSSMEALRRPETPTGFRRWKGHYRGGPHYPKRRQAQSLEDGAGRLVGAEGSEQSVLVFLAQQQNRIYGEGSWSVHKGDIVLDCGANITVYTREALDEGAALVIAIEPAPVNVECLRLNLKLEIEQKRVIIEALEVWDTDDVLPLYEDPRNSGADSFIIRAPTDRITRNIPLTSIDKLSKQLQLPRVSFIKTDIKGATAKALEGAKGILISESPRLRLSTEELEITLPRFDRSSCRCNRRIEPRAAFVPWRDSR
jgi:FkbM family methyltransferase